MANSYVILHTTGGLGGTMFAGVNSTSLPAGFTETVTNAGNDVKLDTSPRRLCVAETAARFRATGSDVNEKNVANALNNFFKSTAARCRRASSTCSA